MRHLNAIGFATALWAIAPNPAQWNNKHSSNPLADILSFKSGHFIL
ncbi:MAG: hypothetical protein KME50_02110 [Nostoc desertorum CM1-VF14]|nr:hypothetical protein [Nostoc desertorum CM1-VF14]